MGVEKDVTAGQNAREAATGPVYDSYARLSKNPTTGEYEKIEIQLSDNRLVIERLGGVLGRELEDGLSAWKRNVRRPGWEELLERVQSGKSSGIVVWHTDRLFRQPRDLEKLIELADKGFTVASARGTRDLSDPDDRFILRIEVAHAARSSDDMSRRIKRRLRTFKETGRSTGGGRAFGWSGRDRTWTPGPAETEEDRPMVSDELVEREREAMRQGTDALLAGISDRAIAKDWNGQGLRTVTGLEFQHVAIKQTLLRPKNAGLIEDDDGTLIGSLPGEPIIEVGKFERLRAKYAARNRGRVAGEVGPGYIGSGVLICGEPKCSHKITVRNGDGFYKNLDWTGQAAVTFAEVLSADDDVFAGLLGVDVRVVRSWRDDAGQVPNAEERAALESVFAGASTACRRLFGKRVNMHVRRKIYTCEKDQRGCGKINADVRAVDRHLRALAITRLSDTRYAAAVAAASARVADRLTEVNAEIADCEELQNALSERLGRRAMSLAAFDRANEPLAKSLAKLYAERESLEGGAIRGPAGAQAAAEVEAQWDEGTNTERRAMVKQALGAAVLYLDRYVQRPGPRRFDPDRLRVVDPTGNLVMSEVDGLTASDTAADLAQPARKE
jgi:DNA invertase Pin-like site-specific DNA recombinase